MLQYRAEFDAVVTFTNGGALQTQGFRVDVPHSDPTESEIGELFVASLNLLKAGRVELSNVRVFAEPHLGTYAGPSERRRYVELSHVITDGMTTYPGLPAPEITSHLTWAESRARYAEGTEFSFDRVTMLGQTGTYLDTPRHRYEGGTDLSGVELERLADLPAVVVRHVGGGRRAVEESDLDGLNVAGRAVLVHTGGDRHWGTPEYAVDNPYLTAAAASRLVERGAALVGIDSVNIDDPSEASGGERPVHTILLAAGIPIVENMTNLAEVPPTGARFTAAPPRIRGFGTFPVRAFATMPYFEAHDHTRSAGRQPSRTS